MSILHDPDQLRVAATQLRGMAETMLQPMKDYHLSLANNYEGVADAIEELTPEMRADLDAMMASLRRH